MASGVVTNNLTRNPVAAPRQARNPPAWKLRLLVAIAIWVLSAVNVVMYGRANPDFVSDLDQVGWCTRVFGTEKIL